MDREWLKARVKPYKNNYSHPYYRPFVIHKNRSQYNVFLVGINPATPIYENEIALDKYIDLLLDDEAFYKEYKKIRINNGKTGISRTRLGIKSFVNDIETHTGETVLETNAIAYPTKNVKELKKAQQEAVDYGADIFYEVLEMQSPRVIVVHGKKSLESLVKVLNKNNLIGSQLPINQEIIEIENSKEPFIVFNYQNGKKGMIFVCRHLMYYGREGRSFSNFKEKVINYLNVD